MSHLDRVRQVSIFETTVAERRQDVPSEAGATSPMPMTSEPRQRSLTVGPDMTPAEMRETLSANWDRPSERMGVANLPPRHRGHHY